MARTAWLGSLVLICGALFFQYVMGLYPCQLCIWQRIPHYIVLVLGALAILRWPALFPICGLIILAGAGIAIFHVGVEQQWWSGLSSCSGDVGQLSVDDLMAMPVTRCDAVAWSFLGLSMAAWNAIFSLGIAGLWFIAAQQRRR